MTYKLFSFSALALLVATLTLSGCGIKPKELSPPTEQGENPFPSTYPSASTEESEFSVMVFALFFGGNGEI